MISTLISIPMEDMCMARARQKTPQKMVGLSDNKVEQSYLRRNKAILKTPFGRALRANFAC